MYLVKQHRTFLQILPSEAWETSWWVMQTSLECQLLPQVSQDFFHAEHFLFLTFPISILDVREQQAWLIFHLHALAGQNDRDRRTPMLPRRFHLCANLHHPVIVKTCSSSSWSSLTDVTSSASSSKVSFSAADAPWNCLHFNSLL